MDVRARRGSADECGQGAELRQQLVQVVRPDRFFGFLAFNEDVGGADVAPVVKQNAMAGRGDPLRERANSSCPRRPPVVSVTHGPLSPITW